jgi:hypothetical protein
VIIDPWVSACYIRLALVWLCLCCNITSPSLSVLSSKLDLKGQRFPGRCVPIFLFLSLCSPIMPKRRADMSSDIPQKPPYNYPAIHAE